MKHFERINNEANIRYQKFYKLYCVGTLTYVSVLPVSVRVNEHTSGYTVEFVRSQVFEFIMKCYY